MKKLMFDLRNKLLSIKTERRECRTEIRVIEERIKNLYELEAYAEETIDRVQELIDKGEANHEDNNLTP